MEEKMEELKNVEINDEELENVSGGGWMTPGDFKKAYYYPTGPKTRIAQILFNEWEKDGLPHTYDEFLKEIDRRFEQM